MRPSRRFRIPACYGKDYAKELIFLAKDARNTGCSTAIGRLAIQPVVLSLLLSLFLSKLSVQMPGMLITYIDCKTRCKCNDRTSVVCKSSDYDDIYLRNANDTTKGMVKHFLKNPFWDGYEV